MLHLHQKTSNIVTTTHCGGSFEECNDSGLVGRKQWQLSNAHKAEGCPQMNYKLHLKTHSGEKSNKLRTHLNIHSGETMETMAVQQRRPSQGLPPYE